MLDVQTLSNILINMPYSNLCHGYLCITKFIVILNYKLPRKKWTDLPKESSKQIQITFLSDLLSKRTKEHRC